MLPLIEAGVALGTRILPAAGRQLLKYAGSFAGVVAKHALHSGSNILDYTAVNIIEDTASQIGLQKAAGWSKQEIKKTLIHGAIGGVGAAAGSLALDSVSELLFNKPDTAKTADISGLEKKVEQLTQDVKTLNKEVDAGEKEIKDLKTTVTTEDKNIKNDIKGIKTTVSNLDTKVKKINTTSKE